MSHVTDEALVLFRYDEAANQAAVKAHLDSCARCRRELATLTRVLAEVDRDAAPVHDADYGATVWRAIESRLDPPRPARTSWWPTSARGWARWLAPQTALAGALAAALFAAFHAPSPVPSPVRAHDEVLVGAVEDHLERTGLMLTELNNTDDAATVPEVRAWAEDLASANRLYRQSARLAGDERIGRLLDDLERVLLEVAHAPDESGPAGIEDLRGRLDTRGVAFKVRMASAGLRTHEPAASTSGLDAGL
jgi:hypothetical protein